MSQGVELGNVLLARIRPGGRVLLHVDTGWAPEFYTSKFYVVLRGNAEVVNRCGEGDDEEQVRGRRGWCGRKHRRLGHAGRCHW
ncbi:hypothetical protein [Belnapia rosea]|nr:hypothetical protein [Belnapia rosea]